MKKKHLLRSILAIALCILMIGTVIAVGYTIYENVQGKKVVIDKDNNLPVVKPSNGSVSAPVTTENGLTVSDVTLKTNNDGVLAVIPQGTKLNDGVKEVTLTVKEIKDSQANIKLEDNEEKVSYDIHIEGVANDNTAPIMVYVKEMLPIGLNMGNYSLYHVENGTTTAMTVVNGEATHNSFEYDAATGDVTLYLASFSEVALVADTTKAWEGTVAEKFAAGTGTEDDPYIIANADQLAYFGKVVGGMGYVRKSFANEYVKLVADINLADDEKNNVADKIFHPIGYYYTDDKNADGTTGDYYSTVYSFEGTFDGNGNTISNFYQNTWEIKGDYDGNYYKDAMGLFSYVVNGTVKNLTVDNFSSDGEFTPTGVIAAYAVNSTFENIAITNCNPRVYNTGNGGIVGVGGNSTDVSDEADKENYAKLTFTNITVDNTNKISALWGSWDVACGGIMGMFRGNGLVNFTNCHMAAQIDVYNDVCGNYQYHWYRYAGMLIGSIRGKNTTDGSYTVPDITGISANNCTVDFGDWNNYYYCELVANSLASYTHDHQFSRLTEIASLDEIKSGDTWKKAGNFLLSTDEGKTCYHIVNKDGVLTPHLHTDAGEEVVNGETVLKENNQIIFLPFNQLIQGDGWGVKHIAVNDFKGITILSGENSVEKFEGIANSTLETDKTYQLSELFQALGNKNIYSSGVWVTVTKLDENDTVVGEFTKAIEDWENGTISFTGTGSVEIKIQDYNYCKPTTIKVTLKDKEPEVKFENKFTGDFLYRVGNGSPVSLSSLFSAKDGVTVGNVAATIETISGNATGKYTSNATWTNGSIQFSDTGVVKVTITDNDYCTPTEVVLEVVNGNNITSATSSLNGVDIVLLNDVTIASGGTVHYRNCTVYGNGFTFDVRGGMNAYNSKQGHGIIITIDATIDNLVVLGDVYDKYGAYTNQEDYTGAIDATNTIIQNCHISNCAAPIRGNGVTIKNSTLYGGTVANIIISGGVNTLENVTTVNYADGRGILGFGIVISDGANENVKLVLNGELKQYNFVCKNDISYVPDSDAQKLYNAMFESTYSKYQFQYNGTTYVNTGIVAMVDTFDDKDITNNTTNTANGYIGNSISFDTGLAIVKGYLYSMPSSNNSIDNAYNVENDIHKQGDYLPTLDFDLGNQAISKDGDDDTRYLVGDKNGVEALYQNNEAPITLDLTKLATAYKYAGVSCNVSVSYKNANGDVIGTNTVVELTSSGTLVFTVTDSFFYDANGDKLDKTVKVVFEIPLTVSVKEASIKNAVISVDKTNIKGDYDSSKYMTFNPLEAISITDYDISGAATTVTLNKNIASKTVEYANTSSGAWGGATITITYTDRRVLIVHLGTSTLNSPGSSNGGKTITIQSNGSIKTDGKVANKSATGGTWTINGYSFKGNNGSTVTNNTKVTVTFDDESGCVTGDTLVALADGTQKRIDEVTYNDTLLVWDFFTGEYAYVPASVIFYHGDANYTVLTLSFEDGTNVKVINNHGFFDVDANEFVFIDETNVESYIGHSFVKVDGDSYTSVELIGYTVSEEFTGCYSIQTAQYINFMVEDMFSMTIPPFVGWFDYFEIGDGMKYDEAKMQEDIEKYGLYTYDDFKDYVTYEQFIAFNGPYLKVLVGRGVLTFEDILNLIATYVQ